MMGRRRPALRSVELRSGTSLVAAGVAHVLLLLAAAFSPSTPSREDPERAAWLELTDDPDAVAAGLAPDPHHLASAQAAPLVRPVSSRDSRTELGRRLPVTSRASADPHRAREAAHHPRRAPALSDPSLPRSSSSNGSSAGASGSAHRSAAARLLVAEAAARRARLIAGANPCGSLFPSTAASDLGWITLELQVAPSGTASAPRILSESPAGQGFAEAARLCASRLRFWPALDAASQPIATTSVVRLRFAR